MRQRYMNCREVDCTVVDLETTGLDPKRDKIIEIGALKIRKGKVVDSFSKLVNPGRKLPERIVEITNITDDELKDAPYIEDILPVFLDFARDDVLMGHSVLFDYSFLKKACVNAGIVFEREGIDTLRIARRHLAFLESRRLPFLCEYFQMEHNPHRALSDVEATYALYEKLVEDYYCESLSEEEQKIFQPSKLIYQVKKETPATKHQLERLKDLIVRYDIQVDCELDRLTRSEASRMTDQIKTSHPLRPTVCG